MTVAPPRDLLKQFGLLFVLTWLASSATCNYGFAWTSGGRLRGGDFNLAAPVAIVLAVLALHRFCLVGRRWRPGWSDVALALVFPGAITVAFLAGLADRDTVRGVARGVGGFGAPLLGIALLAAWSRELPRAGRRAKACAGLVGVLLVAGGAHRVVAWLVEQRTGGWDRFTTGLSLGGVPWSATSGAEAAALIVIMVAQLVAAIGLLIWLPVSVSRSAREIDALPTAPVPDGAVRVDPPPGWPARALGALAGVGLSGSLAIAASDVLLLAPVHVPGWPLAALPWIAAPLLARRWTEGVHGIAVAPDGVIADGRHEPWSAFTSWDARADRFTLHGACPRVVPLDEDDPRRGQVAAWIEASGLKRGA